jgi:hypothetical protein
MTCSESGGKQKKAASPHAFDGQLLLRPGMDGVAGIGEMGRNNYAITDYFWLIAGTQLQKHLRAAETSPALTLKLHGQTHQCRLCMPAPALRCTKITASVLLCVAREYQSPFISNVFLFRTNKPFIMNSVVQLEYLHCLFGAINTT